MLFADFPNSKFWFPEFVSSNAWHVTMGKYTQVWSFFSFWGPGGGGGWGRWISIFSGGFKHVFLFWVYFCVDILWSPLYWTILMSFRSSCKVNAHNGYIFRYGEGKQ